MAVAKKTAVKSVPKKTALEVLSENVGVILKSLEEHQYSLQDERDNIDDEISELESRKETLEKAISSLDTVIYNLENM
jgi:hypothetical protein